MKEELKSLYLDNLSAFKALRETFLKDLLGPFLMSPNYQCEKAINAYYSVKYTHQQGESYKNFIKNMYYLNDDFCDELYHFSVALERYLLNNKHIDNKIMELKDRTKDSSIYEQDRYIKEFITQNC